LPTKIKKNIDSISEKVKYQHRKDEHLSLAQKYWHDGRLSGNGLENIRLIPNTLPEISMSEVDISSQLFDHHFEKPFYIEAMTGGTPRGDKINAQLAEIAKNQHIAMAVGSQSIALKYPELEAGFTKVREIHKNGFLFANIGANIGVEEAKRAVDMIDADALEIHVNVIQEIGMPDGDKDFYWLDNINEIASLIDLPVIVKEVGFGMSQRTFKLLEETAVSGINVGGSGGTNFAWIEKHRTNPFSLFLDEQGLSLAESLIEAEYSHSSKKLIATGGIQYADQIVKSQILGASLVSSAGDILFNLVENGADYVELILDGWSSDLKRFYTLLGAKKWSDLRNSELIYSGQLLDFINQRK
jgi:isopentenyl-diphosphate delta-isomerase